MERLEQTCARSSLALSAPKSRYIDPLRGCRNSCTQRNTARHTPGLTRALRNVSEHKVAGNYVTAPKFEEPRGVVHFLGGAFAGAAPQIAYQFLINWIADAGYTVVSTPYSITFRHLECASTVHRAFEDTLFHLRKSEKAWMAPRDVPVHGMGHSNGALLHLLIGSSLQPPNSSNVVISYNNKQVKEAIPVPLDNLSQVIRNARTSSVPFALPTTEAILEGAVAISAATRGVLDRQTALALKPAIDQIGEVLDEVGNGYTDFVPSPYESRSIITSGYSIPHTLLVQFSDDGIDESALIAPSLRSRGEAVVARLPGSHVTPCGADSSWQVGRAFTPLDAFSIAAKSVLQTDLRRASRKIVEWLDAKS